MSGHSPLFESALDTLLGNPWLDLPSDQGDKATLLWRMFAWMAGRAW